MVWVIFIHVIIVGTDILPDIKSMLINTSSFFNIFHFLIALILVEWLFNVYKHDKYNTREFKSKKSLFFFSVFFLFL